MFERVIIVRDKTRLEQLIERFNSKAQAQFYIERSGGDFNFYQFEHDAFHKAIESVQESLHKFIKYKVIFRAFLPTYIFTENDLVVVVGQDGLVANTAKYIKGLPIIGVNPDVEKYDGVLLKYDAKAFEIQLQKILNENFKTRKVTLAKAELNDGQSLLAFNDFYIGANSHVSSRYEIDFKGKRERHSSSGVLVSTGAGSTGWLSSVFNMMKNINKQNQNLHSNQKIMNWEDEKLIFVVREPFLSKTTQVNIGYGVINGNEKLKIESQMTTNGIIFSDGIESDFLSFNSGSKVKIGIAKEKANLVENAI